MKKALLIVLAVVMTSGLAIAEDGGDKDKKKHAHKCRGHHKERMMKHFDKDGDGKLSEDEKATAKKAHTAKKAEWMKKYDKDGDGKLSEDEKAEFIKAMKKHHSGCKKKGDGKKKDKEITVEIP